MAIRNPSAPGSARASLVHNLDYAKAAKELESIRVRVAKTPGDIKKMWQEKTASLEMAAKMYRLFEIFVDQAHEEYRKGRKTEAVAALMLGLQTREMIPDAAISEFISRFKKDFRQISSKDRAQVAKTVLDGLKFFELAPAKLRVAAAKIRLQLGSESDVEEAGKLFGQAIEIGLQSCRTA